MTGRRSFEPTGWWRRAVTLVAGLALSACATTAPTAPGPQYMIVGIDEKVTWDDAGKVQLLAPGKDLVSIVDISNPEAP